MRRSARKVRMTKDVPMIDRELVEMAIHRSTSLSWSSRCPVDKALPEKDGIAGKSTNEIEAKVTETRAPGRVGSARANRRIRQTVQATSARDMGKQRHEATCKLQTSQSPHCQLR